MQFVVFAAFAIVLSAPQAGPPWGTLPGPTWAWIGVSGQVVLAIIVGWLGTRSVKAKLEREPAWLPSAQKRLGQVNSVLRILFLATMVFSVFLTDLVQLVQSWPPASRIWGLDEVILLTPFLLAVLAGWWVLYPADRAVRQVALELQLFASVPTRPVWSLRKYLSFMFRQHVLVIAVPMLPIVIGYDATSSYAPQIRRLMFNLAWADQLVLVLVAGSVFLVAPVILRYVWQTRPLPAGDLRTRLEAMCARLGLTYRKILIWESDGVVVNAAVMGLFRPVRYVLLSDGLLEMMDDRKIEAVFGHEAGHVKCRHIQFFMFFAIFSMWIVGGLMELAMRVPRQWPGLIEDVAAYHEYLQMGAMALVVMVWGLGFGYVSRRFEWQADLYGARSVTPTSEECHRPCIVHGTSTRADHKSSAHSEPLCATAAVTFADALERIAVLNGIPIESKSWRHGSIASRIQRLRGYGYNPSEIDYLERTVGWIKRSLVVGVFGGVEVAG